MFICVVKLPVKLIRYQLFTLSGSAEWFGISLPIKDSV
jgi:hypothetical protein